MVPEGESKDKNDVVLKENEEFKEYTDSEAFQHNGTNVTANSQTRSIQHKMLSISTTSIKSLIPSFYSLTGTVNLSTPNLGNRYTTDVFENPINMSPIPNASTISNVSDELARGSDVTVSTNVTPQAEYKGFASYVLSCIFIFVWICWSLLPDRALNALGIYYYPSRWWALAIPSYVLCLMVYMYVAIACYDMEYLTLPLNDTRNIVDDSGIVVTQLKNFKNSDIEKYICNSTSGVWDLPISVVNEILYSNPIPLEEEPVKVVYV